MHLCLRIGTAGFIIGNLGWVFLHNQGRKWKLLNQSVITRLSGLLP